MNQKKIGRATACGLIALLFFALAVPIQAEDAQAAGSPISVSMRPQAANHNTYELLINEKVVLRYRSMNQGLTAGQRAAVIMERLRDLGSQLTPQSLKTGVLNGASVILVGNNLLITVTQADAQANNTTGAGLAEVWLANIKAALDGARKSSQSPSGGNQENKLPPQTETTAATQAEKQMLELVNKERAAAGLSPLAMDTELVKIARLKARDMIDKGYFDHISPTYGDPFQMMKDYGIKYTYAGENLAGNQTVEAAHETLMNSPGHKANILNANYTYAGIGIVAGGPYGTMFVQMFICKP